MFKRLIIMALLLLPIVTAQAQGAPDQINDALADLSQRVGRNLTLNDLFWDWSQEDFGDTSLGCGQEGTSYAQVVTPAYIFNFKYGSIMYEYRVSADRQIVILCSEIDENEAAQATPTAVDPNFIDSFAVCANPEPGIVYQRTRLVAGIQAQVSRDGEPNNLRSAPNREGESLAQMPPGAIFTIQAGPECGSGLLWWQVNYDGTVGWTAEGNSGEYWLEPVPGRALPTNLSPITVANAASLTDVARVELNVTSKLVASRVGSAVAVAGDIGTDGVWLFDLYTGELAPQLLRTAPTSPAQIISLDFGPDARLVLGDREGNVRIWDTAQRTGLLEVTFLEGHQSDTGAVAFNPDGTQIASVGSVANTLQPVERSNAIIVWNVESISQVAVLAGHRTRVNALDYSPDGTLLASGSGVIDPQTVDNSVRLWNPATGEQIALLEGHTAPVRAVAFSPDGTLLASAGLDGSIILWDVASRTQSRVLQTGGTPALALAFNPDGTLLASAGGAPDIQPIDSAIRLWDVSAGTELGQLSGHTSLVGDLAFSADGQVLISVDDVRNIRFWTVASVG